MSNLSKHIQGHNPWAIIVGRGAHGKREAAERIMVQLRSAGFQVGGALAARNDTVPGGRYELVNQASGARVLLAKEGKSPDICDLKFEQSAFDDAEQWCRVSGLDVVFVELGKLEANGRGLWPTFVHLMCGPPCLVLAVIRPEVLADIAFRLPDPIAWLDLTEKRQGADESFIDQDTFVRCLIDSPRPTAVFGVRGNSNSGKTRLVEQLLPYLIARGSSVATVKHASHKLSLDVPGKDSRRHAEAGASRVLLVGPSSASLFVHQDSPVELRSWLPVLGADADLVLVEGYKKTTMPHVEIRVAEGADWCLEQTTCEGQHSWILNRPTCDGDLEFPEVLLQELTQGIVDLLIGSHSS